MMRRVGFFRELPHGDPNGPSLSDAIGFTAAELAVRLGRYLEGGRLLAAVPTPGVDVLDSTRSGVPSPHLLTDGQWVWPADLAHYVERYHVGVPDAFLVDIAAAGWRIEITDGRGRSDCRELRRSFLA
ncbi:MAG TPA: hypothetical protein VL068_14420 [Microthrixaceae bacterium]|nr:hypothetical protein [Microthrixaceae bacterium]